MQRGSVECNRGDELSSICKLHVAPKTIGEIFSFELVEGTCGVPDAHNGIQCTQWLLEEWKRWSSLRIFENSSFSCAIRCFRTLLTLDENRKCRSSCLEIVRSLLCIENSTDILFRGGNRGLERVQWAKEDRGKSDRLIGMSPPKSTINKSFGCHCLYSKTF